ncbi:peptidase T. Metallo peptidase. MEROPS family M20B [bacterium A37T11]|nr:peptidase T. Metallo peptidase. MEROPS family M20B [bacterium A37T11]
MPQIAIDKSAVANRFLKYVQLDTQSDHHSSNYPSTSNQLSLARILVEELLDLGITDAQMDNFGYVYATLPANSNKSVPVICFCSHMDTSPDCSGTGVKPIVHEKYHGQDLVLPDDVSQVIRLSEHPDLKNQLGNDVITASGTTLLGADDKAGIAEIMTAIEELLSHPEIKHGMIKILFTPDEEIGRGVDKVDLIKLGADFGYTVDGETAGTIEDETFSADAVRIAIQGVSVHPGFAKGKMQSAVKIASAIVAALPEDQLSPETTSGREGFIHPVQQAGTVEQAQLDFIIRAFTEEELLEQETKLESLVIDVLKKFPKSRYTFTVTQQYRNMKQVLDKYPQIVELGKEAIKAAGMEPICRSIRGGTDGSRLSFMGLPCPNIFAGGHAFHGRQEWISIQDMQKAVLTLVNLARLWEERVV